MGRRGPAPEPTALKRLKGNPGRRKLNDAEPQPRQAGQPSAPKWLPEAAREEWRRVVNELHATGVLTTVDLAVLEAYCISYANWRDAEILLKTQPRVIESDKGNLYISPWANEARACMRDMLKMAQELGMTPSARSRIQVTAREEELSLADELMLAIQK